MADSRTAAIESCLEQFDFDKVHRAMVALDWVWAFVGPDGGYLQVPSHGDLVKRSQHLLSIAWERQTTTSTGGLRAEYLPPSRWNKAGLSLSFILEEVHS